VVVAGFTFYVFDVAVTMLLRDTSVVVMNRVAPPNPRMGMLRVLLLAFVMTLVGVSRGAAAVKKPPGDKFFNEPEIRTFNFEISEAASNQLRRAPRSYVIGTVREGQHVLTNVAIRLKGMGSFRTIDDKPSLAVKFDEFTTNQHYRGLSKLMFNNSVQDSTYLAELLATQLFRDAGVPAARYTHARVRLNGRDLGLYVVAEAMNKQFLKQHFKNGNGNLYEAYLGDIDSRMEQDGGRDTSMSDVRKLYVACSIPDPAERWREVNKVLDVDRFLSFVAMEMLTSHWDGYAIHTNNYRIYHDPPTDKFVFITHGIDWAFKRTNVLIQPPMKSIVGRAVLSTPEGQKLYSERVGTLFTNIYKVPVITNRLEQALVKVRGSGLPADDLARLERRAGLLQQRIQLRAENVADQLAGIPPVPLKFDASGVATLNSTNHWRDEPDRGEPLIDLVQLEGKDMLHIQARNERTRASWRAQVYLTRGWYRFEGMARTASLTGGSARLRISGDTRSIGISGSSPAWRPLVHLFEVQDAGMDVEFVCELTALQGEAWFDVASLRLRKLSAAEARPLNPLRFIEE
jgi:hypothetical protein